MINKKNIRYIIGRFLSFISIFVVYSYLTIYWTNSLMINGLEEFFRGIKNSFGFGDVIALFSLLVVAFFTSRVLSKQFIGKLSLGYILYLITSYFIYMTQQINNKAFKWLSFQENHLFQFKGLAIVIFVIFLSYLLKIVSRKSNLLNIDLPFNSNIELILSFFTALFVFSDDHVLGILNSIVGAPSGASYFELLVYNFLLAYLGILCCLWLLYKGLHSIRTNTSSLSLAASSSMLLSVIFNYTFQFGVKGNSDLLGKFTFPGATLFQITFLFLIFFFLYLLFNRFVGVTIFIISLGTIISIVNDIKEAMRSEPLLITDIAWLKEARLIIGFVNIKILFSVILGTILVAFVYIFLRRRFFVGKITNKFSIRLTFVAIIVLTFTFLFSVFKQAKDNKIVSGIPVVSSVNNWYDISWMGFAVNARYKSLTYVWTRQLTDSIMKKPEGYSKEKILSIAKKYQNEANELNKSRETNIQDETLIYILSESFSNPNRVEGVTLSTENVIPNITQIKSQTTSGLMRSDGYGGGTANMEFQALTGLPYYNFSSNVSTLYTQVVPRLLEFPSISNFYSSNNKYVIHPSGANNYGRKNVYQELGFDNLIFSVDSNQKLKNIKYEGVSVSDQTVYNNVLDLINTKKAQFFSVITMQNHLPWSEDNPKEITGTGVGFTDEQNGQLTSYARLLFHTDQSTIEFLNKLSTLDKNITVVFYGDHLPGFYPESAFKSNPLSQYQTDYFIWSNHNNTKLDYSYVNSSDLTADMLAHTDSKVSAYYALLTDVLNNSSVNQTKLTAKGKAVAKDLKMLQYDITLGKNYIAKDPKFFKLPGE